MQTKKVLVIIVAGIVVLGGGAFAMLKGMGDTVNNSVVTNDAVMNVNASTNTPANTSTEVNTNSDLPDTVTTNSQVVLEGKVFLKGYKTPSESYGILTTAGFEVGLDKYDTMKEQFRAYVGEKVSVTFSRICKSTNETCCRTLFPYCGTVETWTPLEE